MNQCIKNVILVFFLHLTICNSRDKITVSGYLYIFLRCHTHSRLHTTWKHRILEMSHNTHNYHGNIGIIGNIGGTNNRSTINSTPTMVESPATKGI